MPTSKDLYQPNLTARKENITIRRLDDFVKQQKIEKIDFLKIDTEGWELEVLRGASEFISEGKVQLILCEVGFARSNKRNTYFAELNDYLVERGMMFYALYGISYYQLKWGNHYGNALYVGKEIGSL